MKFIRIIIAALITATILSVATLVVEEWSFLLTIYPLPILFIALSTFLVIKSTA